MKLKAVVLVSLYLLASVPSSANGVLRNGTGARSTGLAGADTVFADDPLAAINSNPSDLSKNQSGKLQINLTAGVLDAEYDNAVSSGNDADSSPGLIPEIAYAGLFNDRLGWGLSISPISAVEADWIFLDPPGALGSYGRQTHKSSFIPLRTAFGLGYQITPRWSVGASAGLIYNRNRLKIPYIFQTAAGLTGAKVLVNLEADGFGANAVISTNYLLTDTLALSLAYTTPTWFEADGTLRGNSDPVIGVGSFRYDAEVETELPQIISGGLRWQANQALTLGLQVNWIDWSSAFNHLPVMLTNGNNGSLPATITDSVPLDWDDQVVFHLAGEYAWSDRLTLRAGYSFADNTVPSTTLTPTTAAITEHSLGFGLGYRWNDLQVDLGYQWNLPNEVSTGDSRLLFDEYDNASVDVSIHTLSIGITFEDPF